MQQRFETFTVLIAKISRSIRRIKAEEMSEFHLKGPHVSCLYYLTQLGPLTAGQLCDRRDRDRHHVVADNGVELILDFLARFTFCRRDRGARFGHGLRLPGV